MYYLEVYTKNFRNGSKKGIYTMQSLFSFDYFMKGIIKNVVLSVNFKPVNKKYSKGVCDLSNYLKFRLSRSERIYTLMILVPDSDLKFFRK